MSAEPPIRGRYEPLERVGRGGQGVVFRSLDRQHQRQVAIKIRPAGGEEDRNALLREARVLLDLPSHPNLPLVRDDFFEDERYFMVSDWITGEDLQRRLARIGRLSPDETLAHLEDVASALDHLHAHGVVHGDVKPANIIATHDGRSVLVDLGATPGTRLGTEGYRAPELASSEQPDPAADVFGLAATAYSMLTGRPPAAGGTTIDLPSAGELERAIRRATATDPAARHHSASALLQDLRAWREVTGPATGGAGTVLAAMVDRPQAPDEQPAAWFRAEVQALEMVTKLIHRHGGSCPPAEGDRLIGLFDQAAAAVSCAVDIQRMVARARWPSPTPVRLRMGLASGPIDPPVSARGGARGIARRIAEIGNGGQILLAPSTAQRVEGSLPSGTRIEPHGGHRLRDLKPPVPVHELVIDGRPGDARLRSLDHVPNNIPVQLTSFFGREDEIAELSMLLAAHRIVTITGSGGSGKTRLALQVAAEAIDAFGDGVHVVELASLTDPRLLPDALATALHISTRGFDDPIAATAAWLEGKRALLLLDNVEHLVDETAPIVERLLVSCASLRILVTTREPLRIPSEIVWRIPALQRAGDTADPEDPALKLFIARATQARPDLLLAPSSLPVIASICRQLDGMPLAIELAAAAVSTLSLEEVRDRLDDRFRLLAGGARTTSPRQRTLLATMDWSFEHLDEADRVLFRRLSVFSGGFSMEAAGRICDLGDIGDGDRGLGRLVDKSLLVAEPVLHGTRYRMLETVRQYAEVKLEEAVEGPDLRQRHCDFFLELAERAAPELSKGEQAWWLDALETEHPNLRRAIGWCLREGQDPSSALRIAAAVWRFWWRRRPTEGRRLIERSIAAAPEEADPVIRAGALVGAAVIATDLGDLDHAARRARQSLSCARAAANDRAIVTALLALGNVESDRSDFEAARAVYEETLEVAQRIDLPDAVAAVLGNLGKIAYFQSDYAAARTYMEESLAMMRASGNEQAVAVGLTGLGSTARALGDFDTARARHAESLETYRRLGDEGGIAMALNNLANVALEQGEIDEARALHESAIAIRRQLGLRQSVAISLLNLSRIAGLSGEGDVALAHAEEALAICRDTGFRRGVPMGEAARGHALLIVGDSAAGSAFIEGLTVAVDLGDTEAAISCLMGLGRRARTDGDPLRGAILLAAALAAQEGTGAPISPRMADEVGAERAALARECEASALEDAWKQGSSMTLRGAVLFATET